MLHCFRAHGVENGVFERRKLLLTDQLQLSTNSDKLSEIRWAVTPVPVQVRPSAYRIQPYGKGRVWRLRQYRADCFVLIVLFSHLYFRDEPTDPLVMRRIGLLQRLELVGQRQGHRIIVPYMLVIFCQMFESRQALTLGETLPDRHSQVPELTAFVEQGQIE